MSPKKERFHSFTNILKFISGIISWTILVILVIVAGFLLYYFVSVKLYAQKGEAYKPAFSLYTILSPSMEPNIKVYDVIFDMNVDSPEDIKEGDVITFISTATLTKGMTITHRVVAVIQDESGYSYMTKGDNNLANDGAAVPFDNVLGKVLFKIPQLGRVQEFLGTKGGWLIVVVIPALIVIISDILKIFRLQSSKNQVESYEQKEKKKKQEEQKRKDKIKEKLLQKYEEKIEENEPAETERKEEEIKEEPVEEKPEKEKAIKNQKNKKKKKTKKEKTKNNTWEKIEKNEKTQPKDNWSEIEKDLLDDNINYLKEKNEEPLELPKLKTDTKKNKKK